MKQAVLHISEITFVSGIAGMPGVSGLSGRCGASKLGSAAEFIKAGRISKRS